MIHDIAHCRNDKCKVRNQCYRWLAHEELKRINYDGLVSMLLTEGEDKCKYFMSKDK